MAATSDTLATTGNNPWSYNFPAVLSEFTGLGSLALSASTHTNTLLDYSGGFTTASQGTYGSATGQVMYIYTAVPEPSALALLGAGALGLFGYAWRRRMQAT